MPLTVPTARPISIFLLAVGLLWGLIVVGFIALLGGFFGINPPRDVVLIVKGLLPLWWVFLGPLLMVGGAVCTLRGTYASQQSAEQFGAQQAAMGGLETSVVSGTAPADLVNGSPAHSAATEGPGVLIHNDNLPQVTPHE